MAERRTYPRYNVRIPVTISTVDFVSNFSTPGVVVDCSRIGMRMVAPIYFEPDMIVSIKIELIGGPLEIKGKVLECREDSSQGVRYEKTYVSRVQFDLLSEEDLKTLLVVGEGL